MPSSDGFQFDASSYDDVDDLTMDVIENIQSEEAKYSLQDLQRRIYHRSETITPQIELDSLRRIIFGYKKATTSDIVRFHNTLCAESFNKALLQARKYHI